MRYNRYSIKPTTLPEGVSCELVFALLPDLLVDRGFDSFEEQEDTLLAYIPQGEDKEKILEEIEQELPFEGVKLSYTSEEMPDINWNEEWEKNYFQPILIGDNLCLIRAPFHTPNEDVKTEIIISPKMAFGTGNHETTALMMSYILSHPMTGLRVLDMGCGTGILGILALKQGASYLTAIDIDEWAYRNVLENASLNDVTIAEAMQGDASSLAAKEPYDLILANITRNILLEDMPAYASVLKNGGHLILSGFYEEDIDILVAKAEAIGLKKLSAESRNRWTRLELVK